LYYPIFLYHRSICSNHRTFRFQDILERVFLNEDHQLVCYAVGVSTSFLASVSCVTRHSSANTIPPGTTLRVAFPNNPNDVLPLLLLALIRIGAMRNEIPEFPRSVISLCDYNFEHQISASQYTNIYLALNENMIPKEAPVGSPRPGGDDCAWIGNVCPNYTPPEVFQGQPVTSEFDVFGVSVCELAIERIPFAGKIAAHIQAGWRASSS
jgi:hypothetical protein